jgi:hypothetical protein
MNRWSVTRIPSILNRDCSVNFNQNRPWRLVRGVKV